jgi:VWFA-related protein
MRQKATKRTKDTKGDVLSTAARFLVASLSVTAAANSIGAEAPQRVLEIQAVASDKRGNPVTDLKRDDLEVWINGRRIPVEALTAVAPSDGDRAGRLIVLLLDDVTVDFRMAPRVRDVARRFIDRMMPEDRMAVVLLNGGLLTITSDPVKLRQRVGSYSPSIAQLPVEQLGPQVLTTIAGLARELLEAPEARKAIVAVGSGWVFDTPVPPPQVGREVRREWLDAVRALATADVTFYVIDPGGIGVTAAASGSDGFARDAGGHAFVNTNDLAGAVDRVLRERDHYYVISVGDPPFGKDATIRDLDVRSLRRDVTVRARRMLPGK